MCVGKVYEAESAFKNNQTFLHGEPPHLSLQSRIERENCLCAINVSVGDMPFVFTGSFDVVHLHSDENMRNIAVVFSDVTECSGSDRCGSIKPFAWKQFVLPCGCEGR